MIFAQHISLTNHKYVSCPDSIAHYRGTYRLFYRTRYMLHRTFHTLIL